MGHDIDFSGSIDHVTIGFPIGHFLFAYSDSFSVRRTASFSHNTYVHTAHDIVRQRWMPWRTMSDNIVPQLLHANCHAVRVSYDIVRYVNSDVKSMCSITATPNDIVRHHPMSYDVVRSVNTADRQTDGHNTVALARPSVRSAANIQEP